jgi:monoamine oxidase
MTHADVVVIGAGAAGIAAARELRALKQDFLLLEASHRIGGRAYTEHLMPGVPFDLGAHWLMAASANPLLPLARAEGLLLDEAAEHYTVARYFEDGAWLPDDAWKQLQAFWDAQFAALRAASDGHDRASVFDVIDNDHRWAPYFHMFFAQDFTRDVDQASVEDVLAYVRREHDLAVATGLGNLLARYGAAVPVALNSAVRKIDWSGRSIKLDTARGTVRAGKIILTVSTGVLAAREIDFFPALPPWKTEAILGLPLGSSTRVALMFDKPLLRELPAAFTVRAAGDEPLDFRSRPFGYDYLEVSTGGRRAGWLEKSGQRATIDYILERLRQVAGNAAVPEPVRHIVSAWSGDPWVRGSYSCARPGAARQRSVLALPVDDRIFFAGEATSGDNYASIHGACFSGRDAARATVARDPPTVTPVSGNRPCRGA